LLGDLVALAAAMRVWSRRLSWHAGANLAACSVLAEGYPLRWLTAPQSTPVIDKYALVKDCAQWALACSSVLYVAWLRLRPGPAPTQAQ
jgi:hypothetical protein